MWLVLLLVASVAAEAPQEASCGSSIVSTVFITLILVLLLQAAAYLLWKVYWKGRSGQHLVLETDPEKGDSMYAFDNPNFKEAPITVQEGKPSQKMKWPNFSNIGIIPAVNSSKVKSMDDSYLAQPSLTIVPLRSHDFTGLGFNICGNMRDGIFVKDVLHRGPASESGRIMPGDRIDSVKISLRHVVLEDALTILSYASPYEVELAIETRNGNPGSTLLRTPPPHRICHPTYRSHSISDLYQIGKLNGPKPKDQTASLTPEVNSYDLKVSTLDRKPKAVEAENSQNTMNCIIENVQKTDNVFTVIELDEVDKTKESGSNVKSMLVKGIKNLKDKLQHSLHPEEGVEPKPNSRSSTLEKDKGPPVVPEIKDEGFKSVELTVPTEPPKEVEKEALGKVSVTIPGETTEFIMDDSEDMMSGKKNKRKAPKPPQTKEDEAEVGSSKSLESVDSDAETGEESRTTIELNSTHITVHQAPENESRKASSLVDLSNLSSRNEAEGVTVLERAVSLDLADGAPNSKKRKAPLPPQEVFLTPFKESRMEASPVGGLKKSSVWGTLEDVMNSEETDSDAEPQTNGCSTPSKYPIIQSDEWLSISSFKIPNDLSSVENDLITVEVANLSWDLSTTESGDFESAVNGTETPPELPTSPIPTHPFITEIKVSSRPEDSPIFAEHVSTLEIDGESPDPEKSPETTDSSQSEGTLIPSPQKTPIRQRKIPEMTKPSRNSIGLSKSPPPSRIPVRAGQRSPGNSLSPSSTKRSLNGHFP